MYTVLNHYYVALIMHSQYVDSISLVALIALLLKKKASNSK